MRSGETDEPLTGLRAADYLGIKLNYSLPIRGRLLTTSTRSLDLRCCDVDRETSHCRRTMRATWRRAPSHRHGRELERSHWSGCWCGPQRSGGTRARAGIAGVAWPCTASTARRCACRTATTTAVTSVPSQPVRDEVTAGSRRSRAAGRAPPTRAARASIGAVSTHAIALRVAVSAQPRARAAGPGDALAPDRRPQSRTPRRRASPPSPAPTPRGRLRRPPHQPGARARHVARQRPPVGAQSATLARHAPNAAPSAAPRSPRRQLQTDLVV